MYYTGQPGVQGLSGPPGPKGDLVANIIYITYVVIRYLASHVYIKSVDWHYTYVHN